MKVLQYITVAVFLVSLTNGCSWDNHNMDPMGESVQKASDMQKLEYPPCIGPEVMDGQKQAHINTNYVKSNSKKIPSKTSTTSTDAFKVLKQ